MGLRINTPDIEYGNDCLACFPAGKTPKYVYVRFLDIILCVPEKDPVCATPPNDRVFKLPQLDGYPCSYYYTKPDWTLHYEFYWGSPPKSRLDLIDPFGRVYFLKLIDACAPEGTVFHNGITQCTEYTCARLGIGIVSWKLEALEVMNLLNIEVADDLFMEMRPLDDGRKVFKFCRLEDATNIAILYESD